MNIRAIKLLSAGALCLAAGMPMAWGDITVTPVGDQYKIIVNPSTVCGPASLVLAWDTEDRGEALEDWAVMRTVTEVLDKAGGEFTTQLAGIPAGSVVRAFATYPNLHLLKEDAYVELSGNQYFVTDLRENATSGLELKFAMKSDGTQYNPLVAGTQDGFTIGQQKGTANQIYIRCHDGEEIGNKPRISDNWGVTTLSLKRGGDGGSHGILNINGKQIADRTYAEPFVLCSYNKRHRNAPTRNLVYIGRSSVDSRYKNCKWYSIKFWGFDGNLVHDYVPACLGETPCLYDMVKKTYLLSEGTGSVEKSGEMDDGVVVAAVSDVAEDPAELVVAASWTGEAGDGAVFNPRNWSCTNPLGDPVADGVPGAAANVTLTGEIDMCIEAGQVLTCRSITINASLKRDASWLGRIQTSTESGAFAPVAGSVLELNGHNLTVAGAYIASANQWSVKNSATGNPATLCLVTAEDEVCENKLTMFNGNLRLEKRGTGTYMSHPRTVKPQSDYKGGTYLVEGLTKIVEGTTGWDAFGGNDMVIHIGPNAMMDVPGANCCATPIYLDGGTIFQTAAINNNKLFRKIILTADSKIIAIENASTTFGDANFDLQGHTLTVDLYNNVALNINNLVVSEGLFKVIGAGIFIFNQKCVLDAEKTNFDITGNSIQLWGTTTVHDFTCNTTAAPNKGRDGNYDLFVSGTFRPVTRNFTKTILMDGATLSLVDQTGTWSVDGSVVASPVYTRVVFPETGTIYVDVTGRTDIHTLGKSESPYLVKWHTGEVPTGVKFKLIGAPAPGYGLVVDSTGLGVRLPAFAILVR